MRRRRCCIFCRRGRTRRTRARAEIGLRLCASGVERAGNQNIMGVELLHEHLQALKNMGYVTITQEDVLEYYQQGKELPEKSLFLIFGRWP